MTCFYFSDSADEDEEAEIDEDVSLIQKVLFSCVYICVTLN